MHHKRIRIGTLCAIVVGLGAACPSQAAPAQGPCGQITAACQRAGFVQGGAKEGYGLQVDCLEPIMQGTAQLQRTSRPLPPVNPRLVAACKASDPRFGQRKSPPSGADAPPSPASPPPPAATAQNPERTGGQDGRQPGEGQGPRGKPNIILVLTDDLDRNLGTLEQLPQLKEMFAGQGVTFPNMFVSESLCCPSRSSIQRAQYVHNHQVLGNVPPNGGFEKFHALHEEASTIGTWVKAAGYRTGFMGKYLNGYPNTAAPNYVPPGWDDWNSPAGGNPYREFNYTLNENGTLVKYGQQPQDYLTDVLARKATDFIRTAATDRRPFFLFVATYAPHQPATPAPRHGQAFPGAKAPRLPSYNEADVSDKPAWVRSWPLLTQPQEMQMDTLYRKRLQSMLAVQDLVEKLLDTLRTTGHMEHTYIVFTSDNGFHMGEHRLHAGKLTAYEEDIRVPLFVRGPGVPAGREREELVGNVDLAPTVAELAGASVPDFVDGRSLVPLLGDGASPERWRGAFLTEQEEAHFRRGPAPRQVLEPQDLFEQAMAQRGQGVPAYAALRTATHTYVVYANGERELYDLRADPYELDNIITNAEQGLVDRLDAWLNALRKCHGAACRVADVAPPH